MTQLGQGGGGNLHGGIGAGAPADIPEFGPFVITPEQSLYKAGVSAMEMLLQPQCAELFGNAETRKGDWNPSTLVSSLTSGNGGNSRVSILFVPLPPFVDALTITVAPTLGPIVLGRPLILHVHSFILLNENNFVGEDEIVNAATLLHELGHVYNGHLGSGGSPIQYDGLYNLRAQTKNRDLIDNKCVNNYRRP